MHLLTEVFNFDLIFNPRLDIAETYTTFNMHLLETQATQPAETGIKEGSAEY